MLFYQKKKNKKSPQEELWDILLKQTQGKATSNWKLKSLHYLYWNSEFTSPLQMAPFVLAQ